jgi:hypothetical protein
MKDKSKTRRHDCSLSDFAPRGFGFVYHSIAILYHEVPNPNITIRNFCIAVGDVYHQWVQLQNAASLARALNRSLCLVSHPTAPLSSHVYAHFSATGCLA